MGANETEDLVATNYIFGGNCDFVILLKRSEKILAKLITFIKRRLHYLSVTELWTLHYKDNLNEYIL